MSKGHSPIRESLSFLISMTLHGSVIAVIALGPMYLPELIRGRKAAESQNSVEFAVMDDAPTEIQQVQQLPATPAAEPIVAASPVATKPEVKKTIATQLPKKAKVTPAPAPMPEPQIQETPLEDVAAIPLTEEQASSEVIQIDEPIKDEVAQAPVQEVVEEKQPEPVFEEQKVEPVQEVAQAEESFPAPAPVDEMAKEELKESAEIKVNNSTEQIEKPAATTTAPGPTASTAGTIEGPGQKVEQTFASLKQAPGNTPPNYSREMRLKKLAGRGQLVYFVTKDGTVSNLRLTKSTGVAELDKAAVAAFSKYRFIPGQDGYTVHDFEFTLKGPEIRDAGRLRTSSIQR